MKYFVLSDVHNHFSEMMSALCSSGFDRNNPNHKIILVGDAFDRGEEAVKVFSFLIEMISLNKLIWVAGNHELFILKRFKENFFKRHGDTYNTLFQIASDYSGRLNLSDEEVISYSKDVGLEDLIKNNVVSHFETPNYIFIHSSLPTIKGQLNPNWRDVPLLSWCGPAMKNGMKSVIVDGIAVPGKTIVCGHSPSAYGNVRCGVSPTEWDDKRFDKLQRLKSDLSNIDLYKPFYGEGVIGIDANCYKTGFVNCIVIEEEMHYGK